MCYSYIRGQMEEKRFNQLLKKAKTDEKAFNELYSYYYKRIVHEITSYAGVDLAYDVAQIFFLNIIQRKKTFKFVHYPTAWVYTCCRNIAKKIMLNNEKYMLDDNVEAESVVVSDNFTIVSEWIDTVYPLISDFDKETQKMLYLLYVKGYSLKEIAIIMNIKYSAVRKRHSRVLKHLKKKFENEKKSIDNTRILKSEVFEHGN